MNPFIASQKYILNDLVPLIEDKNVCMIICEYACKRYELSDEQFGKQIIPIEELSELLTIPGLNFDHAVFGKSIRERLEFVLYDMDFPHFYGDYGIFYFCEWLPIRLLQNDFQPPDPEFFPQIELFVTMMKEWWESDNTLTFLEANFQDAKNYQAIYDELL